MGIEMKKLTTGLNISNAIGWINIIIVTIISLCLIFIDNKKIPQNIYLIVCTYVKYSYVISVFSMILSILINKKILVANVLINISYIILYILIYYFTKSIANSI